MDDAARIAVHTVRAELDTHGGIDLVRFVLFSEPALREFEAALRG
jgi:O-acetyl-ADP-ribose deacetylase (regulator of RNase III)